MPTPKQLTQMAYDMGVAGIDLNTLTFAVVDAMEASGEYYGPYNPQQRTFLEQYLIEEITPDRIEFCREWLAKYQPPQLLGLSISNSIFYVYDGYGTPIGNLIGLTAGSVVTIVPGASQVSVSERGSVIINGSQSAETEFDVTFRETLFASISRYTTITFYAILPGIQSGRFIATFYDQDMVEYIATFDSSPEFIAVGDF